MQSVSYNELPENRNSNQQERAQKLNLCFVVKPQSVRKMEAKL